MQSGGHGSAPHRRGARSVSRIRNPSTKSEPDRRLPRSAQLGDPCVGHAPAHFDPSALAP
jgi:hypothetical protein